MKKLKLFPKFFLYTLAIMLFVVVVTHVLIYLLLPRIQFELIATQQSEGNVVVSMNQTKLMAQAVEKTLPITLSGSLLISVLCSLLLSRAIAHPIKGISAATERMMELEQGAGCPVHTKDEIGTLAQNVNDLYSKLLSTIEHLEQEKNAVQDMERAKVDFLRSASHELKTPVTALNATLENMILGVGKYRDYAAYLPACKEMVERLSGMIHEILETSRLNVTDEQAKSLDLSDLLAQLCEPYRLIAAAHQISFSLSLPDHFPATLLVGPFSKSVSNILANAVAYTETGKAVSVYMDGRSLVIENECVPIPDRELHRLFEPFYRPDFSRNRESGGNGLGLYIVDTLLTAMDIQYSFTPMNFPQGMCFTIRL